jgi:hypothetical protein
LGVGAAPHAATVLRGYSARGSPLLGKVRLVDHEDPALGVAQVLDHVGAQVVADSLGVPDGRVEQALHALRPPLADGLSELPAVLTLDPLQQPRQVAPHPRPHLHAPKPMGDALLQALPGYDSIGQDSVFPCVSFPRLRHHAVPPLWGQRTALGEVSL